MKKMAATIIFLIILSAFVFAGCLSFSKTIDTNSTTEEIISEQTPETTTMVTPTLPEATSGENTGDTPSENSEDTTAAGNENEPASSVPAGSTEYDILRSGNFYLTGTMTESGSELPLEMAITPNSMYMLSNFEGAMLGMLISDGSVYMVYPEKNAYLEVSKTMQKTMGISTDDLISTDSINFAKFGPLSDADSTREETVNGQKCTVYVFNDSDGSTCFYMNGSKLVRFASLNADGTVASSSDIDKITADVPAEKINPASKYKKYNMLSFMGLLSDLM